jgi:hypothetical protein
MISLIEIVQKYNKFPLSALVKQAKKFNNFKEFELFYTGDIFHGWYWHLSKESNFKISDQTGPRDMSSMHSNIDEKGALMITSDLDNWDEHYNGEKITRPYFALIDASDLEPKELKQVSRGFGNEVYVSSAMRLKILGVYDRKRALALDRKFQSMIPQSEEELKELYDFAHR